jgi:dephospho-CoA kinase
MPLKEKLEYADYIIENNGTVEEALKKTKEVFARLTEAERQGYGDKGA